MAPVEVEARASAAGWGSLWRSITPRWGKSPAAAPSASPGKPPVHAASPAGAAAGGAAGAVADRDVADRTAAAGATHERERRERGDAPPDFGYQRGLEKRYRFVRELGRGGNGLVRVAEELATGAQWAVKTVPKALTDPALSDAKRAGHAEAVRREVEVLRRLRGCLNVAALQEVFEDEHSVHLVLELCRGGELHHHIGSAHYSERTVASYMRAVLRTLAQCHAEHILHRDIKPGNFLLASDSPTAPLKAIDFGLAVFFDDDSLPRTDLGLEGTPWFMAPETLRSEVFPASDVWAAGVMAHQLLTGRFPFDDRAAPYAPSLSKVWRSILTDELNMKRSHWEGISPEAKDFVQRLLNKDPAQRPSARQALQHPWLQGPGTSERGQGRKLAIGVVKRIQRYSQGSAFKRGVLDMIAEELLREGGDRAERAVPIGAGAVPVIADPQASPLVFLYEHLSMTDKSLVDRQEVADGLEQLGYRLAPEELERLLDSLDVGNTGKVAKSQVAASQIDWRALQQSQTERWLKCVRRAFEELDLDRDGIIQRDEMVAALQHKLPPDEVEAAVRHALQEAARRSEGSLHRGGGDGSTHSNGSSGDSVRNGMTFRQVEAAARRACVPPRAGQRPTRGPCPAAPAQRARLGGRAARRHPQFVRMLRAGSADCLDLYDDRHGSWGSSSGSLNLLAQASAERSVKGSTRAAMLLHPIKEAL